MLPARIHRIGTAVSIVIMTFALSACTTSLSGPERHVTGATSERIYDGPVPVQVFDGFTLATFIEKNPVAAAKAGLAVNGTPPARDAFVAGDWRPADFGSELRSRFDLRSFPSLLPAFTSDSQRTHLAPDWQPLFQDRIALTVQSEDLQCTYVVFATADWNNNGIRDWLVLHTQQSPHDRTLRLCYWLVLLDPKPKESLMQATLISIDEYEGLRSRSIPTADSQTYLQSTLRDRILPATGRKPR